MSQQSLADKTVEWSIAALRAFATLPADFQIVPFVSDEKSESERLIVKCEVGARLESGVKPYQCLLSFKFKTARRSEAEANDIFAKVQAALQSALSNAASIAYATANGFTWLQIFTEESETTTDSSTDIREYTRTLPLRANAT